MTCDVVYNSGFAGAAGFLVAELTQCPCEYTMYLSLVPSPIKVLIDSGSQDPVGYCSVLETKAPAGRGSNTINSREIHER